ncbi:MAG: haloacid dehalogenase-like hydrolase [Oscillospiraceae bacterium]
MIASFVFDLDSTVLRGELLPAIGEAALGDRALGGKTMESVMGQVPFDRSFPARVERLRSVPVAQAAELARRLPRYEELCAFLRRNRGQCYLATGNLDVWIAPWPGSWDWRAMCFPLWPRWRRGM